ncbi:Proteophosphoglycan ppg4 [Rhodotorula toruloides ATCC 204091]|uniref:Proteophosphoglycan ppg4 n=1 Tax=Rhodotorula toruloides TaxID=5286 RepID=A0A0K3CDU0_RHOTO|nr:Proteophosphoglycan ppg4 [Rhodotorula toruloides ATCC 204091]PRQ74923.1 Proteophosphoglycan ppg4 [Rhodotorula toruloides]
MPLPDESRPGRASELIRRFQAAVDDTGEKPLTVSSSFAAPAAPPRPRQSGEGTGRKGKDQADGKEVVEAGEGKPLFFRSAGLKEKPAADESAPEPSQPTENPPAHPASPPHPVVTQPSLDVPPSVPIPGSTDLLSSPSSPAPATEHEEQELSSLKAREGLSRPTSPAADEKALRTHLHKPDYVAPNRSNRFITRQVRFSPNHCLFFISRSVADEESQTCWIKFCESPPQLRRRRKRVDGSSVLRRRSKFSDAEESLV